MSDAPRFAKNISYNLLGQAAPAVVHLISIPLLIRGLGKDRFALLTVIWVLIGYSTILDLGIPRSLTGLVAARIGAKRDEEVPAIVGTGLFVLTVLGVFLMVALVLIRGFVVRDLLKVPADLQLEASRAFVITAVCLPLVVTTGGIRGALEGQHRFDLVNLLRTPLNVFMLLGPLAVVQFSRNLGFVIGSLLVGRVVGLIAHWVIYFRSVSPAHAPVVQLGGVRAILNSAGWMTVANLAGGAMSQFDRFAVGAFFSLTAITYYATPSDTVTRLLILPTAMMAVGFPAFSEMFARDREEAGRWFGRATVALLFVLGPLIALGFIYTPEALRLWLGEEFVRQSGWITRILIIGVFANGLAAAPFALLQGAGRADLTGKLQLLEVPIYVGSFWLLTRQFGLLGVALAWTVRVVIDAALNFGLAGRLVRGTAARLGRVGIAIAVLVPIVVLASSATSPLLKATLSVAVLLVFLWLALFLVLEKSERLSAGQSWFSLLRWAGLKSNGSSK